MEKSKIFIFRISKGNESGNPIGKCPLDYSKIKKIIQDLDKTEITPIAYDTNGHLDFIHNELWKRKILRQGWGIKNLDLNQEVKPWIENYMLSGKIYWDTDINCNQAKGRWNILKRMLDINENDILIIPKTSEKHINDYNKFVVCQAKETYYFDYLSEIQDFGHCVKIKNIKEFEYDKSTLERGDFGTPYLWAVTEVKRHHSRFQKITSFIQKEFNVTI